MRAHAPTGCPARREARWRAKVPLGLRRHPIPVRTKFGHSLVLTYSFPPEVLQPLVPPGLALDLYHAPDGTAHAFVAVGVVSTLALRPAWLPEVCGRDFILTGYRLITRFPTPGGRAMRGLKIIRSDTDSAAMVLLGNMLTRYHYRQADIAMEVDRSRLTARVHSKDGKADLEVTADLASSPAPLPEGSPFASVADARRFAGPLPYTFDYERRSHSVIVVKAVRNQWRPEPVAVRVSRATFFDQPPFAGAPLVLANAFHVSDLDYGWEPGSRRAVDGSLR